MPLGGWDMGGLADWARSKFGGDMVPQPVKGLMEPIDADALANELSLAARGNEAGARESPPSDATSLDIVEQEINGRLNAEWTLQRGHLISMLRAYRDRLAELNAAKVIGGLRLSAKEAGTKFASAWQEVRGDLARLRNAYVEASNELSAFRIAHNLARPARDPGGTWANIGLLFIVIALESVLNGVFFAKGSETGLIGGVGVAIGISLVNVLICFFLGWGPARYVHWRNWLVRIGALLLCAGGLVGVALLHFFAAHFRDATAAVGEKQAYATAVDKLWHAPFGFTDVTSWYLFALGLAFGVIAFWKGYRLDDPYPRYGATYRREHDAYESYAEKHDEFFDELKEIRDKTIGEFSTGLANIPEYVAKSDQVRAARISLIEEFKAYEHNLEHTGNRLLTIYREACRQRRSTPTPKYFSTAWALSASATTGPEIAMLVAEVPDTIVGDVKASLDELDLLSRQVLKGYDDLVAATEHPTDMK